MVVFKRRHSLSGANSEEIALHLLPNDRSVAQHRDGTSQEFATHSDAYASVKREASRQPAKEDQIVWVILHEGQLWPASWADALLD